jgi:dihydroorotate dehydrogenase electron transfer subunit
MTPPHAATRGSILVEDTELVSQQEYEGAQYLMRLAAPRIAARARPGSFLHLRCDPSLPMRRPMSIMRADAAQGWIELLYKAHGAGTRLLAARRPGERLSAIGPIGMPFVPSADRRPLLLGGGVGIPPMVFLAETLRRRPAELRPLAILGSEIPFPFRPRPSTLLVDGMPADAIATMPLLEDWGIACRLASRAGIPGSHDGWVTDLAGHWLGSLSATTRGRVELFACGPTAMLAAVARLARQFGLPCQVSVEEYMACAVGGCAGCAIAVHGEEGVSMQRVCVDGPVFEASRVFPEAGAPN